MINTDLIRVLGNNEVDFDRLKEIVAEVKEWNLEIDKVTISFIVRRKVTMLMEFLEKDSDDLKILKVVEPILRILSPLSLNLDLWKSQNIYFDIGKSNYNRMKKRADKGNKRAVKWVEYFERLGNYLKVNIP